MKVLCLHTEKGESLRIDKLSNEQLLMYISQSDYNLRDHPFHPVCPDWAVNKELKFELRVRQLTGGL